ncbi:MAG TPA: hypothetical protein VIG74_05315, partial [Alphaproteobacteria bacterium]
MARFEELRAVFDSDYARVAEVYELMLGEEVAAYGTRAATVFSRWEAEGGGPTLPAMLAHAFEYFDIDPHSAGAKAVMVSGIIAEM